MLALFCGIVLALLFSMHYRLGTELADDGAFFLRYAENMLKGYFWVWNIGEPPVWGASAPLWPLVVAIPMALGVSPKAAIIGTGLVLSAVSLAAVTLMLGERYGRVVGFAFLTLTALDTHMMYFSGSGLETPLTIALLAFGLRTLLYRSNSWVIGLVAGLLMVNKLDLVPAGVLLLVSHWIQDKQFPRRAFLVAVAIALAWYGFAWIYFGAPVPNSFLTKSLHQENLPKIIDWRWFGGFLLWFGFHKWLAGFGVVSLIRKTRALLPLIVFLCGMLVTHLVTYTIKYPFEPYNWYAMPSIFALLVIGAIGIGEVSTFVGSRWSNVSWIPAAIAFTILVAIVTVSLHTEKLGTSMIKQFASHQEFDRAEAGRWVNENTPGDFVVFTAWGNPAYYSQRKVIDGSFLNRPYEPVDLIKQYRPDVLILQFNPGSTPMNQVFDGKKWESYKVIKVFDKTYIAGIDYFFAVLAREDIIEKIRNIDPPRDLTPFVSNVQLGDRFGTLKPQGNGTIFVHPGMSAPTRFNFNAFEYLRDSKCKTLHIHARIAPNVPQDAIQRGAASVRLSVLESGQTVLDAIVRVGEPVQRSLQVRENGPLEFIIDNNGNPDTDWMLLSIQGDSK